MHQSKKSCRKSSCSYNSKTERRNKWDDRKTEEAEEKACPAAGALAGIPVDVNPVDPGKGPAAVAAKVLAERNNRHAG